jgi:hypothetical protein
MRKERSRFSSPLDNVRRLEGELDAVLLELPPTAVAWSRLEQSAVFVTSLLGTIVTFAIGLVPLFMLEGVGLLIGPLAWAVSTFALYKFIYAAQSWALRRALARRPDVKFLQASGTGGSTVAAPSMASTREPARGPRGER